MEIQGVIKLINETQTLGAKGFRKREMVVTTDEKFPQHIPVEFVQDKVDLLDKFAEGQTVKIDTNVQGREWINPKGEAKYFLSLQGWRIESLDNEIDKAPFEPAPDNLNEDTDDVPF